MKTPTLFSPAVIVTHLLRTTMMITPAAVPHARSPVMTWPSLSLVVSKSSFTLQRMPDRTTTRLLCVCSRRVAPRWGQQQCWTTKVDRYDPFAQCFNWKAYNCYPLLFFTFFLRFISECAGDVFLLARATITTVFQSCLAIVFCPQLIPPTAIHRREARRARVST